MLDSDHVEEVISEVLRNFKAPQTSSPEVNQEFFPNDKVIKQEILIENNTNAKINFRISDDDKIIRITDKNQLRPLKAFNESPLKFINNRTDGENNARPWTISELVIIGVSSLLLTLLILLTALLIIYKVSRLAQLFEALFVIHHKFHVRLALSCML